MLRASRTAFERATTLRVAVMSLTPKASGVGVALNDLGFRCYDLQTVFSRERCQKDPGKWVPFLQGREQLDLSVMEGHDALVGLPGSGAPDRLIRDLPGYTKIILVVETDKQAWVDNYNTHVPPAMNLAERLARRSSMVTQWLGMMRLMFPTRHEQSGKPLEPLEMLENFEDTVKRRVQPHRLLVYHPGDGWDPLIHFLQVEHAMAERLSEKPFPADDNAETYKVLCARFKTAYMSTTALLYGMCALCLLWVVPSVYFGAFATGNTENDNANARVKALVGVQVKQRVFPILEALGPEATRAGTETAKTFGLPLEEDEQRAVLEPTPKE